jgi:hypothetical protein
LTIAKTIAAAAAALILSTPGQVSAETTYGHKPTLEQARLVAKIMTGASAVGVLIWCGEKYNHIEYSSLANKIGVGYNGLFTTENQKNAFTRQTGGLATIGFTQSLTTATFTQFQVNDEGVPRYDSIKITDFTPEEGREICDAAAAFGTTLIAPGGILSHPEEAIKILAQENPAKTKDGTI